MDIRPIGHTPLSIHGWADVGHLAIEIVIAIQHADIPARVLDPGRSCLSRLVHYPFLTIN